MCNLLSRGFAYAGGSQNVCDIKHFHLYQAPNRTYTYKICICNYLLFPFYRWGSWEQVRDKPLVNGEVGHCKQFWDARLYGGKSRIVCVVNSNALLIDCLRKDFQNVRQVVSGEIQLDLAQTFNPLQKEVPSKRTRMQEARLLPWQQGSRWVGSIQAIQNLCSSTCCWVSCLI